MAPKKDNQAKVIVNARSGDSDTSTCELTVASMETTLQKFFAEADQKSKDRFERLESQLDSLKSTLDMHTKELDSQRRITTALQEKVKRVEGCTSEQSESLKKLQEKVVLMEDSNRRNNLRIINLKEGLEQGQAVSYLVRTLPKWFPELVSCPPEIMRAHRIGPPRKSPTDPPRTMILNCLRFADRDRILGFAREIPVIVDGKTIRFAADFSDTTARRRRECYPVMNRARALGFQAFLMYPAVTKLTRGVEQHRFEYPEEAEKFLDTIDPKGDTDAGSQS